MEGIQRTIFDLTDDIVKKILICVAESGAENFAKTISSSKDLKDLSKDGKILMAVNFDCLPISCGHEPYQQVNGLVNRCAQAGNKKAQLVLAKVILVSSSQLLGLFQERNQMRGASRNSKARKENLQEIDSVSTFLAYFMPEGKEPVKSPKSIIPHYEMVRAFLKEATLSSLEAMTPHLMNYMDYFLCGSKISWRNFMDRLEQQSMYTDTLKRYLVPAGEAIHVFIRAYDVIIDMAGTDGEDHVLTAKRVERECDLGHAADSCNIEERIEVNFVVWKCLFKLQAATDAVVRSKIDEHDSDWQEAYKRVMRISMDFSMRAHALLTQLRGALALFEIGRRELVSEFEAVFTRKG